MKVLIVTHHLANWSGSELVAIELAEEFEALGHDVDVYAAYFNDEIITILTANSIRFHSAVSDIPQLSKYDVVYCQHSMLGRIHSLQAEDDFLASIDHCTYTIIYLLMSVLRSPPDFLSLY